MTSSFTHSMWAFLLCAPLVICAQMGDPDFLASEIPQKSGTHILKRGYFAEVYKTTAEAQKAILAQSSSIRILDGIWEVVRGIDEQTLPSTLGLDWESIPMPERPVPSTAAQGMFAFPQTHLYRTDFFINPEWVGKQICLYTEGISGTFEVFINERPVAQSNRSMLPSGFDISQALKPGKNWLYIKLQQGNPSQFLEMGEGISQLPRLVVRPKVYLDRLRCQAVSLGVEGKAKWELSVRVRQMLPLVSTAIKLKAEIWDKNQNRIWEEELRGKLTGEVYTFETEETLGPVDYWSCETPHLYQMVLTLFDRKGRVLEAISREIGFKKYQWRRGQFYVNSVETQLKGMTFAPAEVAPAELRHEMQLMKQHNINALWVRGYGSKDFYRLCDSIGFYAFPVLGYQEKVGFQTSRFAWRNLVMDYVGSQMELTRCHPAFVQGVVKDPFSKPILGAYLRRGFWDLSWQDQDEFQRHWVKLNIPRMLKDDIPQALWDTTAHLLAHNWKDRWIPASKARSMKKDAKQAFTRELGYVDARGKPRPSLLILKKWFEPIKLNLFPGSPSLVYVDNHYSFLSLASFHLIYKAATAQGDLAVDTVDVRPVLPGSLDQIILPNRITEAWEGQPGAWLELNMLNPKGEEVAWTQLSTLGEEAVLLTGLESPKVSESVSAIDVYGNGFHLTFDKGIGMLTGLELEGEEVWTGPLHLGFEWNTPDRNSSSYFLTDKPEQIQLASVDVYEVNKEVEVKYEGTWTKEQLKLPFTVMFSVLGNGRIYVDCQIKGGQADAITPRMQWQIPPHLLRAKWLGPGPTLPVNFFSRKGKWGAYESNLEEDYFQIMGPLPNWEIQGVAQMSLCNSEGYGIKIYPLRDNAIYLSSQAVYDGANTWLPVTSGTHVALYPAPEKADKKSLLGGKRLTFRLDLMIPESGPSSSNR
ncbi:MAG: sugar-binding domain-containing protein [Bacteroidota bacterium]